MVYPYKIASLFFSILLYAKKRGILTSLKQRTVSAVLWSFTEHTAGLGITFLVGIVLARVLSPTEFGLIGMITVFITLSATFINSGFGNALIRKIDCSQRDYSTVFFFNLIAGALFYLLLFISAPYISNYFKEPILTNLLRVLALVLVIESFSLIQSTILTKRVDFRLQTRVSVISNICSGVVAILMAFNGYGVWSLVVMQLLSRTMSTSMLWLWNGWRPQWLFSMASFRELLGLVGNCC